MATCGWLPKLPTLQVRACSLRNLHLECKRPYNVLTLQIEWYVLKQKRIFKPIRNNKSFLAK